MYHIKADQRSIRSAETIYKALGELMAHEPFDKIKVSQLVEQAQIGRATFYRNFDLIEDVLRWQCDETVRKMMVYLEAYLRDDGVGGNSAENSLSLVKPILRYFYLHSTIVEQIIQARRIDLLQQAFEQNLMRFNPVDPTPSDFPQSLLEYGYMLRANGAVSILVHWIRNGKREAPDELADGLVAMTQRPNSENLLL